MNNTPMNGLATLLQATDGDRTLFEGDSGALSLRDFRLMVAGTSLAYGAAIAGRRVAIEAASIAEFSACLFAIWASSGTAVLLPSSGAPSQGVSDGAAGRPGCDLVISAAREGEAPNTDGSLLPRLSADASVILYTSGSSGEPKQIHKTLWQLQAEQDRLKPLIGSAYEGSLVAGTVSPQHFYGLVFLVLAAFVNGGVIFDPLLNGLTGAAQFMASRRKRVLVSSPAILDRWAELSAGAVLGDGRLAVLSAGGQLRQPTRHRFDNAHSATLTEIYGSSETGVIAYRCAGTSDDWTPFPGVVVTPLEDEGVQITSSYADNGCAVLADAVTVDAETGALTIHGRLDRTVKVEERRLSLPEMEGRLLDHPLVADAACCAMRPEGALRVIIGAAIVVRCETGTVPDPGASSSLIQSLRASLTPHFHPTLLPRQWQFVKAIPRSALGKISQPQLLELFRLR